MQKPFQLNGETIAPGSRATIDLVLPSLNSRTELKMPVHVVHGRQSGPVMFVSAAVHGDEINNIEIAQRLLEQRALRYLRGTLMVIPVVNVYGVIHLSRYLPDRRDLNRSFPGSEKGSLAARVANIFSEQILKKCSHGIDLHTGAIHRANLPQIRANLDDPRAEEMAASFGAPVLLNASLRPGSLREAADRLGIPSITYEGGEALRYDETCTRAGLKGVINVMRKIGMLRQLKQRKRKVEPFIARASNWVRTPESGLVRHALPLGAQVEKGALLGRISDPYSNNESDIVSPYTGIIIGRSQIPVMHEGEALFHIARFRADIDEVVETLDAFEQEHSDDDYDS